MFAVMYVRNVSREQHEKDLWKELRQSGVTQSHRGMRPFVDFPADGDLLHLPSEDQDHVSCEIPAEGGQPPHGVRVVLFHQGLRCLKVYRRAQPQSRIVRECFRRIPDTAWCGAPAVNARPETFSAILCVRLL